MSNRKWIVRLLTPAAALLALPSGGTATAQPSAAPPAPVPTYADLADLADSAQLVIAAKVRKAVPLDAARARPARAGTGRFLVSARTLALISGSAPIGEDLSYLADLPLDARGKPPRVARAEMLLFAHPVTGRPAELQLVSPFAQVPRSPEIETTVRAILRELLSPGAPAKITSVREAIHVPGALAGEGETQIFLWTGDGSAASISVVHRPGSAPAWGLSFSELVGAAGAPPPRDTLAWYRLACFLPDTLPRGANLSATPADRAQAEADYRMVLGELGTCARTPR